MFDQRHATLKANAESTVSNSQTPGIGRLEYVHGQVLINNLGRNIQFTDKDLKTTQTYDETLYLGQDDPSQFDLDMHAFLELGPYLVAINHLGLCRIFEKDATAMWQCSKTIFKLPGDVERFVVIDDQLVGSSPQGYSVPEPASPGVIVSTPLLPLLERTNRLVAENESVEHLSYISLRPEIGMITALAFCGNKRLLAVASRDELKIYRVKPQSEAKGSLQLEQIGGAVKFNFNARTLRFIEVDDGVELFAAGFALSNEHQDDQNWDALGGGGWSIFKIDSSQLKHSISHNFDDALAWGNGGDPVLVKGTDVYGIDKFGALTIWAAKSGSRTDYIPALQTQTKLGMAHATQLQNRILCGFNRDGYQLHSYDLLPAK